MVVIVTGAAGFIGSNLVEKLLQDNHFVIGLDNFEDFYDPKIKRKNIQKASGNKNFILAVGDIRNKLFLEKIFISHKIDLVVHLAAKVGVRPSIQSPELYYDINLMGTLTLLEVMKKANVKKIVYASSSSVYGNNKKVPFSEEDSVDNPISPYAATKKAGELLCHTYHHLYDFDIFCLRFFTVYGPRQRPDLAIDKFTRLIMEGKSIPFYGDGSTERDYTYIDDIIDGINKAIKNLKGYEIFNLGESKTITLSKMVSTLENALGKKAILERLPFQPGDVNRTYADITKAKIKLGYNPKFTFEDGINNFISWLLKIK